MWLARGLAGRDTRAVKTLPQKMLHHTTIDFTNSKMNQSLDPSINKESMPHPQKLRHRTPHAPSERGQPERPLWPHGRCSPVRRCVPIGRCSPFRQSPLIEARRCGLLVALQSHLCPRRSWNGCQYLSANEPLHETTTSTSCKKQIKSV